MFIVSNSTKNYILNGINISIRGLGLRNSNKCLILVRYIYLEHIWLIAKSFFMSFFDVSKQIIQELRERAKEKKFDLCYTWCFPLNF